MTTTLSLPELLALSPCSKETRKALFAKSERLTAVEALEAGASISDLLWVSGKLGRKDLCVRFALGCAQRVAHLNKDPRVQAALDATQAWLDAPSEEKAKAAYASASSAASSAAYAAADAAADAAYVSAYASASSAAYASASSASAYAAADAAASASSASSAVAYVVARAAERQAQRELFIEIFKDA